MCCPSVPINEITLLPDGAWHLTRPCGADVAVVVTLEDAVVVAVKVTDVVV